jgi:hypothetical protein
VAISPQEFGDSFKGFMDQIKSATREAEPFFQQRLMDHKKNSTGRIDEIVASIIGVVRAMAAANAPLAQKLVL